MLTCTRERAHNRGGETGGWGGGGRARLRNWAGLSPRRHPCIRPLSRPSREGSRGNKVLPTLSLSAARCRGAAAREGKKRERRGAPRLRVSSEQADRRPPHDAQTNPRLRRPALPRAASVVNFDRPFVVGARRVLRLAPSPARRVLHSQVRLPVAVRGLPQIRGSAVGLASTKGWEWAAG